MPDPINPPNTHLPNNAPQGSDVPTEAKNPSFVPEGTVTAADMGELLVALGGGAGVEQTFEKLLATHDSKALGLGASSEQQKIAARHFKTILLQELGRGETPQEVYLMAVKAYWAHIQLAMTPESPPTEVARLLATLAGDRDAPQLGAVLDALAANKAVGGTGVGKDAFAQALTQALGRGEGGLTALDQAAAISSKAVAASNTATSLSTGEYGSILAQFAAGFADGESLETMFPGLAGKEGKTSAALFQNALADTLDGGGHFETAMQKATTATSAAITRSADLQGPVSPGMVLLGALSGNGNITEVLSEMTGFGDPATSSMFSQALFSSLAEGQDITVAQASAASAAAAVRSAEAIAGSGTSSPMAAVMAAMARGENVTGAVGAIAGPLSGDGAKMFQNVLADMLAAGTSPLAALQTAAAAPQAQNQLNASLQQPVTSEAAQLLAAMASGQDVSQTLAGLPGGKAFADSLGDALQSGGSFSQAVSDAKTAAMATANTLASLQSDKVDPTLLALATGVGAETVAAIPASVLAATDAPAMVAAPPSQANTAPTPPASAQPAAAVTAQPAVTVTAPPTVTTNVALPVVAVISAPPVVSAVPEPPPQPVAVQTVVPPPAPVVQPTVVIPPVQPIVITPAVNVSPTDIVLSDGRVLENIYGPPLAAKVNFRQFEEKVAPIYSA
ncbi:MAG: type II secretion system F family protein, partial [Magnetococcus sp. YQC-3]